MKTIRETIELFHLLFLRQLETKLDKRLYALKGGCNLRFFFKSICYSEDIDLDVQTIAVQTLKNKINKIFEQVDFKNILRSHEMEIVHCNAVKQTETTQRWKLTLRTKTSALPLPTKIEFSPRAMDQDVIYEQVDPEVLNQYRLYPMLCNHYGRLTAIQQKIKALIHRTETQASDIFDLKLLLDVDTKTKITLSTDERNTAIASIERMDFATFKSQVVAYLQVDYQHYYENHERWQKIKEHLIKILGV